MSKLGQWLQKRADNPQQNLLLLGIGFVVFFAGILLLGIAEYALKSSLAQEILALLGLIIIGVGIILAAIGYLSLSVLRVLRFMMKDKND
ncbi:MAG: hypothetical protein ACRBB4_11660 [Neptuniibacter sp.]|uniref:hypothetical protein n=1 Tax=Neptuniibacter sp. TaxID=1962643 RepID=UPI003B58CB06